MGRDASQGLPLLMVPGLGLGPECWSPTVRALAGGGPLDRGPAQTVQLPGYGAPDPGRADLRPEVLARTVVDQLQGGPRVVLLGLSAGCQVAAHVALLAPHAVAVLVLVGPTTDPRARTWLGLVRRWVSTARSEPIRQLPVLVRQYRRTGLASMARAMDAARRDRLQDVVPRLSCPVLVLRGSHDRIAPEDWLRSLVQRLDPALDPTTPRRSVTLDAGAHMVSLTHGERVADAVQGFLADVAD